MSLSVTFSGDLQVSNSTSSNSCGSISGDSGNLYHPQIGSARRSADAEIGMKRYDITSPLAYVALPFPAGFQGRMAYLRVLSGNDIDVRFTHATQGLTVYPVASRGMILIEPADDEAITGLEVQGEAVIEWLVTGEF